MSPTVHQRGCAHVITPAAWDQKARIKPVHKKALHKLSAVHQFLNTHSSALVSYYNFAIAPCLWCSPGTCTQEPAVKTIREAKLSVGHQNHMRQLGARLVHANAPSLKSYRQQWLLKKGESRRGRCCVPWR